MNTRNAVQQLYISEGQILHYPLKTVGYQWSLKSQTVEFSCAYNFKKKKFHNTTLRRNLSDSYTSRLWENRYANMVEIFRIVYDS